MKSRYKLLCIFSLLFGNCYAQQQKIHVGMVSGNTNYTYFSVSDGKNVLDEEVLRFNKGFVNHPEIGVLFSNAPCSDCFEAIGKRTETSKYFIKKGSNGVQILQQTSSDPIHIKDEWGNYKTVIATLQSKDSQPGIYTADQQPIPVGINTVENYSYLGKGNQHLYFNRNLTLVYSPDGGEEQIIGAVDWSNHTAGDDGIYVSDAWPGIDIEMRVYRGQIKTNYIIKNPLPQFNNGALFIRDRLSTDGGLSLYHQGENTFNGSIEIKDQSANVLYTIDPAFIYDQNVRENGKTSLFYNLDGMQLDIIIPLEWINRDIASYPITVDPLVSATDSMAITGSGYNSPCWVAGCSYVLPVILPAGITITDIRSSFTYTAYVPCIKEDGALDFYLDSCRSPGFAGLWYTCQGPPFSAGNCVMNNYSIFSDFAACIPSCASDTMNFTMNFYRCSSPGGGCSNACIGAGTSWTMLVEGTAPCAMGIDNTITDQTHFNVYPNPVRENATIRYSISSTSNVQLDIYNVFGVKVQTLVNTQQVSGEYNFNFNPKNNNLKPGMYFISLAANGKTTIMRIVVME